MRFEKTFHDVPVCGPERCKTAVTRRLVVPKNVGAFLNELRGESTLLRLEPYEPWMSMRSHRELL
jgi:hypothetical protein